jgi:type IV secretory pathway TrbF-like protein
MPLAPDVSPSGTLETPAMAGKRHRADELGERTVIARSWRVHAYCGDALLLVALCVIGWLAMQPKLVPVYIEVETASGRMRALGSGEQGYTLRQETIKKELREFVEVIRRVSPDKYLMQKQWKEVFTKVTPHGYRVLSAYASAMNPLAIEGEVRVEILRVLPQSERTYDIRWTETTHSDGGTQLEQATYSGLFTWVARDTTRSVSVEELTANPAGIYLDAWSWSKE